MGLVTVKRTLMWPQIKKASDVGCDRNIQSLRDNVEPGAGAPLSNSWTFNIEGACGELVVAEWLGEPWTGTVGDYTAPDVGPFQVRTNTSRMLTDLCIRPRDLRKHRDKVFISVLSFLPMFEICGWIYCYECLNDPKWYRFGDPNRPKCYYVPMGALRDLRTLPPIKK